MKTKVHYADGVKIWHRVANVDDLLNEKVHRPKYFKDVKTLLNIKTDREAKTKAKEMINDFLSMLTDDMIYNNDVFIFPIEKFGYMGITDKTHFYHHRNMPIRNFFECGGKNFGPCILIDKEVAKKNDKFYHMRFTRPNRLKLIEHVKTGNRYG